MEKETDPTDGAPRPAAPARSPLLRRLLFVSVAVALVGYALDQYTKHLVVTRMYEGQIIDVFPPLLRWYSIRNPGAAFSMGADSTWIFTIIQAVVLLYVVVFLLRKLGSRPWALALGGLIGGVAGNLTDRIFRPPSFGHGHVVDFIALPNFAIFNVADMLIVCSMIGICLLMFTGREIGGGRVGNNKKHASDPAADESNTEGEAT
ncbi:signal peptidase II [Paeniglutamicibacter cryotolerans]|uniref:Lipoprotein signal peptidase n=1 Tax=Paeniglutamicibacter cryotolerans TaxID=670079 RepID=A0A839QXD5_9MICC|nr:signal peptidase II [Paeniglutamicibacter cryotolerans]MBB2996641.1 signal peptidase II [Paeniglutamicibacter cryotolerans]